MTKHNIEDLPQAVKSKILTKQEAARIIWEEVYTKPYRYGLKRFTADQKSDILIELLPNFEKLFDKFIPEGSSFSTYVTGCIKNYRNRFLGSQLTAELERRTLNTYLIAKNEEDTSKYTVEISEKESFYKSPDTRELSDIINQKVENQKQQNKKSADIISLILLMKACRDIDDCEIDNVCNFTGVDKSQLCEIIQNLKKSMSKREEHSQQLISKRNNAFFFHRKYMQQMLMPHNTSRQNELLINRYERQTKKWEKHNKNLSVRSSSPSNEEIAKVLGIKPRMVSFYINHARKDRVRTRFQELLHNDDNKSEIKPAQPDSETEK